MTTWLARNLAVLRQRDPALAARIDAAQDSHVELLTLPQGGFDLRRGDGHPIYGGDPAAATARFWAGHQLVNPLLLVFYGFDLGTHVRHYCTHSRARAVHHVIIEQSAAVFRLALASADWTDLLADEHFHWVIGETPERLQRWAFDFFAVGERLCMSVRWHNVIWLPRADTDGPYYLSAARALKQGREQRVLGVAANPEDELRGLFHVVENLERLETTPLFDQLAGTFAGYPGIVVATGPSLNASLPALRAVADHAVIFACDSAVPVLLEAGIRPHFIACLERVIATRLLVAQLPPLPDTWLVALPVVAAATLAAYPGPCLFTVPHGGEYRWLLGDAPKQWYGPSAATMACVGLAQLGCDPILLVGQDLAFDRESGRSHAVGAHALLQAVGIDKRQEAAAGAGSWVPGNDGRPILSWAPYQHIAATYTLQSHAGGPQIINAIPAAYGMQIEGLERGEPEITLRQHCRVAVDAVAAVRERLARTHVPAASDLRHRVVHVRRDLQTLHTQAVAVLLALDRAPSQWSELSALREHLAWIERQLNNIVLAPACQQFLLPYVRQSYLHMMCQYYERQGRAGTALSEWNALPPLFRAWFEEAVVWSLRTAHLLHSIPPFAQDIE
ncbi:MAG: DUF115 domain-containing protein [Deltaproteobacteria bacterium]|nr:DUF115 domain-containing protein [Deltaproteobacteria bacterium]